MATIRKRGDKFEAQIRRQGFAALSKSFAKRADAREWARLRETEMDRQELVPDRKVLEKITLSDLVKRYRDTVLPRMKGGQGEAIMLNAFLRHPICKKRLSELSRVDFARWRDDKLSGNNGAKVITAKSAKRMLPRIQHMLHLAMNEWNIPLRENPLARFRIPSVDRKRHRRLRCGEFETLVRAAEQTQNKLVLPIALFALETAMRRGELLAMKWEDISLERRTVSIPEAKNGHSRIVPLTRAAIRILEPLRRQEGNVFLITANALKMAWNRLIKRAGLVDLHFHDLRHEAISRLFEMGLTVPEVASISGHRDVRMLLRYAHAETSRIIARLDSNGPSDNALPSADHPRR